jgi:hypothetical protein
MVIWNTEYGIGYYMKEIVRLYVYEDHKEVCIKDPDKIVRILLAPTDEIDLDYHDARGHAKIGKSRDFVGQVVKIGDHELQIPEH